MAENDMMDVRPVGPAGQCVAAQCGIGGMDMVRVGKGSWTLPRSFLEYRRQIRDMEVRPSDVWLLGFPKSGTTWAQELVWLLCNNLDFESARKRTQENRFPVLESVPLGLPEKLFSMPFNTIAKLPRETRRFIKSHLATELLPTDLITVAPKIIYLSRDPRDAIVSLYHNFRTMTFFRGTLDEYVAAVVADEITYAPVLGHVDDANAHLRGRPNVLFLTYEEMKENLSAVIQRAAVFLEVPLPTADQEAALLEYLSFDSMKKNSAVNNSDFLEMMPKMANEYAKAVGLGPIVTDKPKTENDDFIRKGEIGRWKKELSPVQAEAINKWCAERIS